MYPVLYVTLSHHWRIFEHFCTCLFCKHLFFSCCLQKKLEKHNCCGFFACLYSSIITDGICTSLEVAFGQGQRTRKTILVFPTKLTKICKNKRRSLGTKHPASSPGVRTTKFSLLNESLESVHLLNTMSRWECFRRCCLSNHKNTRLLHNTSHFAFVHHQYTFTMRFKFPLSHQVVSWTYLYSSLHLPFSRIQSPKSN